VNGAVSAGFTPEHRRLTDVLATPSCVTRSPERVLLGPAAHPRPAGRALHEAAERILTRRLRRHAPVQLLAIPDTLPGLIVDQRRPLSARPGQHVVLAALRPAHVDRRDEHIAEGREVQPARSGGRCGQRRRPAGELLDRLTVGMPVPRVADERRFVGMLLEHLRRRSLLALLSRRLPPPIAPGGPTDRPPALPDEVEVGRPDALAKLPGFLLSDGRQDVVGEFRDEAALARGVERDAECLQLLVGAHALGDAPAESVERCDGEHRAATGKRVAASRHQESLIVVTIVAPAALDVLELLAENPAGLTAVVAPTLANLGRQRDAVIGLLFLTDATVDQSDRLVGHWDEAASPLRSFGGGHHVDSLPAGVSSCSTGLGPA